MKAYHNTNKLNNNELREADEKALTQQDVILRFFRQNPRQRFTPFDVMPIFMEDDNVPITSIRRAISNLTEAGYLEKTDFMEVGKFGRKNHTWKLAKPRNIKYLGGESPFDIDLTSRDI